MIRTQTRAACTGLFLYALWRENNCLFVNKKQAASHKAACGQNEYSDLDFSGGQIRLWFDHFAVATCVGVITKQTE